MTVSELIAALIKLPPDFEIAVLSHTAHARPPSIVMVNQWAWTTTKKTDGNARTGIHDPARAFLIRPAREII